MERRDGTLYARGAAFKGWIGQARRKASSLPGITHYNDKEVVDIGVELKPPKTVVLKTKKDTLYARGAAFKGWIEQARQKASSLPGISQYNDEEVIDIGAELKPPKSVVLEAKKDILYARGVAFGGWIEQARQKAASLPGITHYNDEKLIDVGAALTPPQTVVMEIKGDTLYVRGTASEGWIEQARQKASSLPGINQYNDIEVTDIGAELKPPKTIVLERRDGTLYARGAAFKGWIGQARRKASSLSGITHYNDKEVINVGATFKPPKTVVLEIKGDTLYARGTAFKGWIEQARQKADSFPAIVRYNDEELVDINHLIQIKDKIERQLFYCKPSSHEIAPGQEQKLRELLKDMRAISDLSLIAKKAVQVEIIGHTDILGWGSYNLKLGKRRAEYLFELLIGQGLDKDKFIVTCVSAKASNEEIKKQRVVNFKLTLGVD